MVRARGLAFAFAFGIAGCGGPNNGTSVLLTITAGSSLDDAAVTRIAELDVAVSGAESYSHTIVLGRAFAGSRQERVLYKSAAPDGALSFALTARDAAHVAVGYGGASVILVAGKTVPLTVSLTNLLPPPIDPDRSTLVVDKSSGVVANGSDRVTITATLLDGIGSPQPGLTVRLAATGSGNTLTQPTGPSDEHGVVTGTLTSTVGEVKSISALVAPGPVEVTLTHKPTVTFTASAATQLVFTAQPTTAPTRQPLAPAVTVAVQDATGAAVAGAFPVTLALASNGRRARLAGDVIQTTSVATGVATFSDVNVDLDAGNLVITASSPGLSSASSAPFAVTARAWTDANNGLWGGSIGQLVADPKVTGVAYAVGNPGVWRTSDGGANWLGASDGLPADVRTIVFHPTEPLTQWALGLGLYKTSNGGARWVQQTPAGLDATAGGLLIDPANPRNLYILGGEVGSKLSKSVDGGATFSPSASGIDATTFDFGGSCIAVDPSSGTLYVIVGNEDSSVVGAYKSTNQGASWTLVNDGNPQASCVGLTVDPATGNVWLASAIGIYELANGASAWADRNNGLSMPGDKNLSSPVLLTPGNSAVLYVGTYTGLFKSSDGGNSWAPTRPRANGAAYAVALDASSGALLIGSASLPGVARSSDGGANFSDASAGIRNVTISALGISQKTPTVLLAAGMGQLWRTADGGASWIRSPSPPGDARQFAFYPLNADTAWAATSTGVYAASGSNNWSQLGLTVAINSIVADPNAAGTLYANTVANGVFKTTNSGANWSALNGGINGTAAYALAVDGAVSPSTVYTNVNSSTNAFGVYKISNGGTTWTAIGQPVPMDFFRALVVDGKTRSTLFGVIGTGGSVYRSTDSGASWLNSSTGLADAVADVAVDPVDDTKVYAAAAKGVYKSTNGGTSWVARNGGLPVGTLGGSAPDRTAAICLDPVTPQTLYVATYANGVYKSSSGAE